MMADDDSPSSPSPGDGDGGSTNTNNDALAQSLQQTTQKVEASLLTCIQEHVNSSGAVAANFFKPDQGLDFLDTKNTLLLSYLIDLTVHLRGQVLNGSASSSSSSSEENIRRLTEMKVVLDKMRGLDKKLRYQIDKLLAAGTTAASFAASGGGDTNDKNTIEDPLRFHPNASELENEDESSSDDNGEEVEPSSKQDDDVHDNNDDEDDDDDDDDLAAARMTLTMAKEKSKEAEQEEASGGVYRAPRLSAVPYTHDREDRQAERHKRERRRVRASEVAQALRSQYGEAPEQEDVHGGSELGRQREIARRLAEKQAEKISYEEDAMVRLTTTRKERKEREQLMRGESSNLAAIASDLGNLVVRGSSRFEEKEEEDDERMVDERVMFEEYSKSKRKSNNNDDFRGAKPRGRKNKSIQAKNALQAALYGNEGGGKSSNKKKKRKRN